MNIPGAAPAELRSFVERIERLEGEIAEINTDKRDVYAEAKSKGFDVPALKAVISYRRKDPDKAEEQRSLFELYLAQVAGGFETPEQNKRTGGVPKPIARPSSKPLAHAHEATPTDAGADGSPRHVAEPAPLTRPPPAPGAGSSFFADESHANARVEAMPTDGPSGSGKAERASRLAVGRTMAPGRDGTTPALIPDPSLDIRNQPFYRGAPQ